LIADCNGGLLPAVSSYWTPTEAQVDAADHAIRARLPSGIDGYHRLYLGVVSNGLALIYVSGTAVRMTEDAAERAKEVGASFDWRIDPLVVCGGGSCCFRAAYDPITRTIVAFRFNGPA
jgi:hypothetical protein